MDDQRVGDTTGQAPQWRDLPPTTETNNSKSGLELVREAHLLSGKH